VPNVKTPSSLTIIISWSYAHYAKKNKILVVRLVMDRAK
jgi:hypothetical protein